METDELIMKLEVVEDDPTRYSAVQTKTSETAASSFSDVQPLLLDSIKSENANGIIGEAFQLKSINASGKIESASIKTEKIKSSTTKQIKQVTPTSASPKEILPCTVCPQTFSSIQDFKKHMRSHTFELMYDCHLCAESFEKPKDLNLHIKYHDNEDYCRTYKCEICSAILRTLEAFKAHKMIHTGEKPFECKTCGIRFRHRTSLVRHGWTHLEDKDKHQNKCDFCDKKFATSTQLRKHRATHTGERNHACPSCPKRFLDLFKLKKHIRTHTGERRHQCELCPLAFKEKHHLERHKRVHTGEKPFCCSMCGKRYGHKNDLDNHLKTLHIKNEDGEYIQDFGPKVKCELCRKVLKNERTLQFHMKRHTGDGAFKCKTCDKFFIYKTGLEAHMKERCSKGKMKRFKCKHCPTAFKDKRTLERHTRLHTGERPFDCFICGRKFIRKHSVDRHMATTHPDKKAKNVKCHICSKTFANYAKLKVHMDQHTTSDEKGYKCGLCNIFMRAPNAFERHMEQHEKYSCKMCNLDFASESEFENHAETHGGDRTPTCNNCGQICDSHKELCLHFMKVHDLPRIYLQQCCNI